MNNLQFDNEYLEEFIMTACIHNKSFFLKVKQYLQTKNKNKTYFKDVKNQIILNLFSTWYDKFDKFPREKEFHLLISRINEDSEIKSLLTAMVSKYYNADPSELNMDFIQQETKKFITEARLFEAIQASPQFMEEGRFSAIVDMARDAINVNFDKDLGLSVRDLDTITAGLERLKEGIPVATGLPTVDSLMDGGIRPKELMVVAGTGGSFKTGTMGCIAVHNFLLGKKVLYYSMETGKERLAARFIQNIANVTKEEIGDGSFREKMDAKLEMFAGDIIVKEFAANSVCSNDLVAHVTDLQMYNDWKPDIIIVDYLLIMKTNDPRLDPGNSYKYYKTVSEEVRNLGFMFEVPVVSAIQVNREGMGDSGGSKALVTSKNIAESAGVFHTADYFITLNQTSKDKQDNRMMLFFEKNRNEEGHRKINTEIDYKHMRMKEVHEGAKA